MDKGLNLYDPICMLATVEEVKPTARFFKDRYFATEEADIQGANKVLIEVEKDDEKMACYIADRVGDIPIDRLGSEIFEYEPPKIAPSMILTVDDLKKRGFGEALYANTTPAERAAKLQLSDFEKLDKSISRREELMAVRCMVDNAVEVQEYIDGETKGEKKYLLFYEGTSEHTYTPAVNWGEDGSNVDGDIEAMCRILSEHSMNAVDLVLGSAAAAKYKADEKIAKMIDKNSGYNIGEFNQKNRAPGVTYLGTFNHGGFVLNVFAAHKKFKNEEGAAEAYFPENGAMVTFPGCGRTLYASVTQIDHGEEDFTTYVGERVPRLEIEKQTRKLILQSRPLTVPKYYCPWVYAEVC